MTLTWWCFKSLWNYCIQLSFLPDYSHIGRVSWDYDGLYDSFELGMTCTQSSHLIASHDCSVFAGYLFIRLVLVSCCWYKDILLWYLEIFSNDLYSRFVSQIALKRIRTQKWQLNLQLLFRSVWHSFEKLLSWDSTKLFQYGSQVLVGKGRSNSGKTEFRYSR